MRVKRVPVVSGLLDAMLRIIHVPIDSENQVKKKIYTVYDSLKQSNREEEKET